ncbi:hypothetical protein OIU78_025699 [Salix suchowensis]|nr:hypothetical protein OIU78_025699 [Salix suchowensis]
MVAGRKTGQYQLNPGQTEFRTEEDLQWVIAKGPWMFGGKHIALQQWHPHFQFDRNNIKTMSVWVRFYGLPFPLWSTEGLSKAASMVGRPLSCDEATFHGTRLDYARMCVEVTVGDKFVHHFELEMPSSKTPCMVRVDYKWKPTRCQQCKTFGHSCLNQEHRMEQDQIPNPTVLGSADNPTNHILPKTDKSKQQPSQSNP